MKARNLILCESAKTFTVYGKPIEVMTFPHSGGRFLAIAYLDDGRQIAGAPGATEMDTEMDLYKKLREMFAPKFDPAKTYESRGRQQLFHGALVDHPYFGKLWISHDVRPQGQDHWEAWNEQGKRATPGAYTERGLHFQLRRYVVTKPYVILNSEPAPAPPAVQAEYTAHRTFWESAEPLEKAQEWTAEQPKTLCHHNWMSVNVDTSQPGMKVITHQCPHCGKQRVLHRRVLEPLPKQPMHTRPPKSTCQHIWVGAGEQVNAEGTIRRYSHVCPKCNRLKVTHRRILPPK